MLHGVDRRLVVAAAIAAAVPERAGAASLLGLAPSGALRACPAREPTANGCVASAPGSAPNSYLAPWRYDAGLLPRDAAWRRVRSYLASRPDVVLDDDATPEYTHAAVGGDDDTIDLELRFLPAPDELVTFRALARRPTPMQPFCVTQGCINGNQAQRALLERVRDDTGLAASDAAFEADKAWVPIFLH